MPRRPESSALIAIRKPVPVSPISRSAGTRASSNAICAIGDDRRPIVRSRGSGLMPGVAAGASRHEMPAAPGPPVRAKTS